MCRVLKASEFSELKPKSCSEHNINSNIEKDDNTIVLKTENSLELLQIMFHLVSYPNIMNAEYEIRG